MAVGRCKVLWWWAEWLDLVHQGASLLVLEAVSRFFLDFFFVDPSPFFPISLAGLLIAIFFCPRCHMRILIVIAFTNLVHFLSSPPSSYDVSSAG